MNFIDHSALKILQIDLSSEYMTIFIIILSILIIIFILMIIFVFLLYDIIRRQTEMRYPVKNKKVIRKERELKKGNIDAQKKRMLEFDSEKMKETKDGNKQRPLAKPIDKDEKKPKVAAVVPVRITSHHSSDSIKKSEKETD